MKKNYINHQALALDILRGSWLLHGSESYRRFAEAFLNRMPRSDTQPEAGERPEPYCADIFGNVFAAGTDAAAAGVQTQPQYVQIIPMRGVLTKYDNCIGVATMEVADILDEAREDESICAVILDIDSPGGAVNSVMPLTAAIERFRESGKPIIAHVDQCASAAYWVASQCDAIFADNILSRLGSIGAYCELVDDRENKQTGERTITVYAPQSTDKNRAAREALDGKPERLAQELSDIVDVFISSVKAGRKDIAADQEGVFTGAMFDAPKAVEYGLADAVADISSCVEIAYLRAK